MREVERVTIVDPDDEDAVLSVVESQEDPAIHGVVLLNPDGTQIGT